MAKGFFKVDRRLFDHYLWDDKPFAKGQAWIDLIGLANFEDRKTVYKGEVVTCERGSVYRSISFLADRWGWSRKKTRAFIKSLESDGMVTTKVTTHRTAITIENYGFYQDVGTTNGTTKVPTKEQQRNSKGVNERRMNKELKEGEEVYRASAPFVPPTVEEISAYCRERNNQIDAEEFFDYYEARGWKLSKGAPMKDWKATVRGWEKRQSTEQKYDNHPDQRKHYGELDKEIFGDEWG